MARCSYPSFTTGLDESPLVLVSAGPVELSNAMFYNNDSAAGYVQLFDAAAIGDVTLGTTAPKWVMTAAATSMSTQLIFCHPLMFSSGLVIAFTSTFKGNDATGSTAEVFLAISRG